MKENTTIDKKYNTLIVLVSIVIPVVVAILFNIKLKDLGYDVEPLSFLPPIYATINGITAVVLIASVMAIKKGNRKLHERLMTFAIALSLAFLVMYVAYHMTSDLFWLLNISYYFVDCCNTFSFDQLCTRFGCQI
jgi:putative membrane protein